MSIISPHNHEHHELALVTAGTATHRTAYEVRTVVRGSILTASPSDTHAFDDIDGLCMVNCTYLTEHLFYDVREILSVPGLASLFFRDSIFGSALDIDVPQWTVSEETIFLCLRELGDIAAERIRTNFMPVLMRRTLEKLMLMLCRSFHESGQHLHTPSDAMVRTLLERIEEMAVAGQPFDATALARKMGVSRDHLAKRFRKTMGRTPTYYYQHRRVQQACCLLLDRGRTVTEVAHELGYFDSAHFSRLFKRFRGMTPSDFRARYVEG